MRLKHTRSISVKSVVTYSGGWRTLIILLVLINVVTAQTEGKKAPAWESTQWTRIEGATGLMNLDGTLRLSFPLGASDALKQLGVRFELEHRIDADATGRPRSDWITRIEQTDTPAGEPPLLQARYDDCGRLISWQVGAEKPQQLIWSEDGCLTDWRRADGSEVRLRYRDNLLSEILERGKPPQLFTWGENPGHVRGDSRWAAPVHLVSDGASDYTYELTSKGFVMQRTERAKGALTTTTFNPRRRRLNQQTEGFHFLVVFRSGPGGSALERIEIGGEIMEKYLYDARGQLTGIQRYGEGERTLSYDESGRLMALEENSP